MDAFVGMRVSNRKSRTVRGSKADADGGPVTPVHSVHSESEDGTCSTVDTFPSPLFGHVLHISEGGLDDPASPMTAVELLKTVGLPPGLAGEPQESSPVSAQVAASSPQVRPVLSLASALVPPPSPCVHLQSPQAQVDMPLTTELLHALDSPPGLPLTPPGFASGAGEACALPENGLPLTPKRKVLNLECALDGPLLVPSLPSPLASPVAVCAAEHQLAFTEMGTPTSTPGGLSINATEFVPDCGNASPASTRPQDFYAGLYLDAYGLMGYGGAPPVFPFSPVGQPNSALPYTPPGAHPVCPLLPPTLPFLLSDAPEAATTEAPQFAPSV